MFAAQTGLSLNSPAIIFGRMCPLWGGGGGVCVWGGEEGNIGKEMNFIVWNKW